MVTDDYPGLPKGVYVRFRKWLPPEHSAELDPESPPKDRYINLQESNAV